jgi:hypothetical protein
MKEKRVGTIKPNVSAGFHCGLLKGIKNDFAEALKKMTFGTISGEVIRNVDGMVYCSKQDIIEGLVE